MELTTERQHGLRRELAVVRVAASGTSQDEALGVVGAWSGRLLELKPTHFTAELAGEPDRVTRFIQALAPFGLVDSRRTGELALDF